MTDKTMMRIDKELLRKLKAKKLVKGESYAEVVKRLIDKEVRGGK
jgi:predicted CopG family antitoxin